MTSLDQQITELECKIAFQDETIELLNQTVIKQQSMLEDLQIQLTKLKAQLVAINDSGQMVQQQEPPPPHY
jgi:SlyX protein